MHINHHVLLWCQRTPCCHSRSVPKTEDKVLTRCGRELSMAGFDDLAREAYLKMGDFSNVMVLYVKSQVSAQYCPRERLRVASKAGDFKCYSILITRNRNLYHVAKRKLGALTVRPFGTCYLFSTLASELGQSGEAFPRAQWKIR